MTTKTKCPKCGARLMVLLYPMDKRGVERLEQVFFAILELKAPMIYIRDICDFLNQDRPIRDQYTNKEVSKLVSVLGFSKKHRMRGTAILYDAATVEKARKLLGEMRMQ